MKLPLQAWKEAAPQSLHAPLSRGVRGRQGCMDQWSVSLERVPLIISPMGRSFVFPVSLETRLTGYWKTSVGARASGGYQTAFSETGI